MTTPQHAEALTCLRAANRAVLALSSAVGALDDPAAVAEVHLCRSALSRLYRRLEAQAHGEATEPSPPSS